MASFEEQIKAACDSREIPGVVLLAVDKSGKFQYRKVFGPKSPTEPMDLDTTFVLASCTKLMTSIAALQCVERGQIGLNDDVSSVLTELKDVEILTGFEEGSDVPILKKAENKITLHHLLTHASGISYEVMSPDMLTRWRKGRGETVGTMAGQGMPMVERLQVPLLFEPGTSWTYGMSTDWAGLLVARLNNSTLEEYMQKNIWDPLGIKDITFHLELKPNVKKNMTTLSYRGGINKPILNLAIDTGKPVEWTDEPIHDDPMPIGDDFGGQGAIASATEYFKILTSLLLNDGKILKPETLEQMFTPQLSAGSKKALNDFNAAPWFKDTFASHAPETDQDFGLAGLLNLDQEATGRKKGTLTWSGLPNLLWTVDRAAGLATFWASNLVPFGDPKSHVWHQAFEKEMYSRLENSSKL